jgi:hypothetical protein
VKKVKILVKPVIQPTVISNEGDYVTPDADRCISAGVGCPRKGSGGVPSDPIAT